MRKVKMSGMIALAVVLLSMLGLPQGFAAKGSPPNRPYNSAVIQSVSNPSGSCVDVSLIPNTLISTDYHGLVTISGASMSIRLQNTSPNSLYSVSIGYLNSNGGCDGTWKSLSTINTDQAGNGYVVQDLSLKSHQYRVELRDSAGNLVYATPFISI